MKTRNKMKRKLLSLIALCLVLAMSFSGCGALTQLVPTAPEEPKYEVNLSFASVDEMVQYAGSHRDTDPRFDSIMDDKGKMTLYELRYMPKGYKLKNITLEDQLITFSYLNKDGDERLPITVMWNLESAGDGKAMLREFIKDHKTLARAGKNIDLFYIETEKSELRGIGRNVYFEQGDILFTLWMPSKVFNTFIKKRSRIINPMDVTLYYYEEN